MSRIRSFLRRFQLQYRQSHPLTKVVMAAAIVLSTITLVSLRLSTWDAQRQLANLQEQAARLQEENEEISQQISELGTVRSIRRIAAEELGMVDADTIIIEVSE